MAPGRIPFGLLIALARAIAASARYVLVAMALSVVMLAGCATTPGSPSSTEALEPAEQTAPISALRMYEQGRTDALDELRALSVWREPARVCVDKVSWVSPDWELPDWGSRKENMELIKECRDGSLHNAILLRRQRQAVGSAR